MFREFKTNDGNLIAVNLTNVLTLSVDNGLLALTMLGDYTIYLAGTYEHAKDNLR